MKQNSSGVSFKYIREFHCLGDKCENTCCSGFQININDEELELYQKLDRDVYQELLKRKNENENSYSVLKMDEKYCNYFTNGLCKLQLKHGIKGLPKTCLTYPRSKRYLNNKVIEAGYISCPEILRNCLKDNAFDLTHQNFDENFLASRSMNLKHFNFRDWFQLLNLIINTVLNPNFNVETSIYYIAEISKIMSETPYKKWKNAIKNFSLNENKSKNTTGLKNDQNFLLIIIHDILSLNNLTLTDIQILVNDYNFNIKKVNNKNEYFFKHEIIENDFNNHFLNNILKKLIAYDISHLTLPTFHLSSIEDKGNEHSLNWGHYIIINFLIRRMIILIYSDSSGKELDIKLIVDIIHRYSRFSIHTRNRSMKDFLIQLDRDEFRKIMFPFI